MTLSLHIFAKFLTKINVNKRRNDSWNAGNCFQNWSPEGVSLVSWNALNTTLKNGQREQIQGVPRRKTSI